MGDVMNWLKPGGAVLIDDEIVATVISTQPQANADRHRQTEHYKDRERKTEVKEMELDAGGQASPQSTVSVD